MNKQHIFTALDTCLSGLGFKQRNRYAVLERIKGKKDERRKLSVALVLVILLVLMAAVALALVRWNPFVEKVMDMEYRNGGFSTWTLIEKKELIETMKEYGIDTASIPDVSAMAELDANKALDKAIEKLVSGEVASLHYNMMEKAKGHFDTWSLEDKAWYSDLLLKYNKIDNPGDIVYMVPNYNALQEETAKVLAKKQLIATYNLSDDVLTGLHPYAFFYYHFGEPTQLYWRIHYRNDQNELCYRVDLTADGSAIEGGIWRKPSKEEMETNQEAYEKHILIQKTLREQMEKEYGPMITWSLENKARVYDGYGIPAVDDIKEQQAVDIAKAEIMLRYDLTVIQMRMLVPYVYFIIDVPEHYYTVNFFDNGDIITDSVYSVEVDANTGEVINLYTQNDLNG